MEICTAVSVICYLCKYFNKRDIRGEIHVTGDDPQTKREDEIKDWIDGRYVSASEAHWMIQKWKVHRIYPPVKTLAVTMESDEDLVDTETGEIVKKPSNLHLYFSRPADPEFDNLKYAEYMTRYIINKPKFGETPPFLDKLGNHVKPRQVGLMVSRFAVLLPSSGELYYLQMIVKSNSLRNLKEAYMYNSIQFASLRECALAQELFSEETEYELAFEHAVPRFTPHKLRDFLVQVSIEGANGPMLMEKHFPQLSDDCDGDTHQQKWECLIQKIHRVFSSHNQNACDFSFPQAAVVEDPFHDIYNQDSQHTLYDQITLSAQQQQFLDLCVNSMANPNGTTKFFYLDGAAGTGKTQLARAIAAKLRSLGYSVAISATTALAATLYQGGRTAHATYGLPVSDNCVIECQDAAKSRWSKRQPHVAHIWDEAPSCHSKTLRLWTGCFAKSTTKTRHSEESRYS